MRAHDEGNRTVLVVADDGFVAHLLVQCVQKRGLRAHVETSVRASLGALDRPSAVIAELALPDGSGFDVVEAARCPCLIVAGSTAPDHINRAQRLGVEYACKPAPLENIERFLERVTRVPHSAALVADVGQRHHLTPAQSRLIAAAMESAAHDALAERLGVSPNTIKTQVRGILARTGAASLEALVSGLRAAALRR